MTPDAPRAASAFVLLHGGRHGGWCWRRVAARLRGRGHEVYTPTLTGLGERSHLLAPGIGLDVHVQDLVSVYEYEDLQDTVLVAHSYGGMVACGAMERIADRVRTMVMLDAHMPFEGESVFDLNGREREAAMLELVGRDGEGWYVPAADPGRYGVTDPDDVAWLTRSMSAQPVKTYQDPIGRTGRAWSHPGMYIECDPSSQERHMLERARRHSSENPYFGYRVMRASHNAMVTDPEALLEILLEAAALVGRGLGEL